MSLIGGSEGVEAGLFDNPELVSLLYRSRATDDFDPRGLEELVRGARARNHARDVTGALYYEDGQFFQWIEGPAPTVSRLFGTIGRDRRHTDVEVVSFGHMLQRVFGDWNLRLYRGFDELAAVRRDPSLASLRGVVGNPNALREIAFGLARGRVGELALALKQTGAESRAQVALCEDLMRCYGDMWDRDDCTELDIVLGLALAQAQFRLHRARLPVPNAFRVGHSVMVLPLPGERHVLGPSLVQASLEDAGFFVPAELPVSVEAAAELLHANDCKHVVLVTSGVLARAREADAVRDCTVQLRPLLPRDGTLLLYGRIAGGADSVLDESGCDGGSRFAHRIPGLLRPSAPSLH